LHRNLPCDAEEFLLAIHPFREDLVVAVECIYSWYWPADLCVRQRSSLLAHIQITYHQYNLDSPGQRISYRRIRDGLGEGFEDASVRHSIAADLALIDHYEVVIGELELAVLRQARIHDPNAFRLVTTLPGIGRVLGLTIPYEIHHIGRSPRSRTSPPTAASSSARRARQERSSAPAAPRSATPT
jgi:hypothetical protein